MPNPNLISYPGPKTPTVSNVKQTEAPLRVKKGQNTSSFKIIIIVAFPPCVAIHFNSQASMKKQKLGISGKLAP